MIGTLFSPVKLCLRWILSIELGLNFRFCIWSFLGGRGGASIFILDEVIITKFQYESCLGELEKKVEIDIFYILNLLCFSKKCKNFTSWWAWKARYCLATLTSWILFIWFVFKTQLESFYTVDKQPYIYIYIHFWVLWCGWQTELATLTADFTIFLGTHPGTVIRIVILSKKSDFVWKYIMGFNPPQVIEEKSYQYSLSRPNPSNMNFGPTSPTMSIDAKSDFLLKLPKMVSKPNFAIV